MCVSCRQRKDKKELLSISLTKDGKFTIGTGGHTEGRSVYVCREESCIAQAEKKKSFSRSLKCEIEPEKLEILKQSLK